MALIEMSDLQIGVVILSMNTPESRLWDKLPRIPQIDLPTLFRLSLDNPRLDNFTYLIWQGSAL